MPKFPILDKFAHGCINLRRENYTIPANDARAIANEYTRMLAHITELQEKIIKLQQKDNEVIEVELDGDTF